MGKPRRNYEDKVESSFYDPEQLCCIPDYKRKTVFR